MITYKEIERRCNELVEDIQATKIFDFDLIIAITKGGLIPAYYIAKGLNISCIETLNINSYIDKEKHKLIDTIKINKDFSKYKVLIVDDLVDTGMTIQYILDKYKFKNYEIATIFHKTSSHIIPDYCSEFDIDSNLWIDFEYEG